MISEIILPVTCIGNDKQRQNKRKHTSVNKLALVTHTHTQNTLRNKPGLNKFHYLCFVIVDGAHSTECHYCSGIVLIYCCDSCSRSNIIYKRNKSNGNRSH